MNKSILKVGKLINKKDQKLIVGGDDKVQIGCECEAVPDPTSLLGVRYVVVNQPCDMSSASLDCFGIFPT